MDGVMITALGVCLVFGWIACIVAEHKRKGEGE